jgi:hypothetical protein
VSDDQAHGRTLFVRSDDGVRTDLYRLLAAVYASEALARLAEQEGPGSAAHALRAEYERREIHETLLRLAAGYRNSSDQNRSRREAMELPNVNPFHDNCGTLQQGDSAAESLSLREACNKILHCESIEHEHTGTTSLETSPIGTSVILRGRNWGREWTCTLRVSAFVECLFFNYDVE